MDEGCSPSIWLPDTDALELSSPDDGESAGKRTEKLRAASQKFLAIGLREYGGSEYRENSDRVAHPGLWFDAAVDAQELGTGLPHQPHYSG